MGIEAVITETKTQPFAIVPQALIADPNIAPADKIIFAYLLGKYQTKRDNGEPWTFSCPSIAKGTALNERTIQRRIKTIRKHGVLKLHGCLMNEKKKYDVFVFVPEALETLIATSDKLSVVIPNDAKGFDAISKEHPTDCPATADSLSDRMSDRSKMEKGRLEKEGGGRPQTPTLPIGYEADIPTRDEVLAYASMRGVPESSAISFFEYHENQNVWINQHGRLINWRNKIITWANYDRKYKNNRKTGGPVNPRLAGQADDAEEKRRSAAAAIAASEDAG